MRIYRDADGNKFRYAPDSPYDVGHPLHGEKIQFAGADRPQQNLINDSFAKGEGDWWLKLLTPETLERLIGRGGK